MIWSLNGHFGNVSWQTRRTVMVRHSRKHWTLLQRLVFAQGSIGSKKYWIGRGTLCTLVCVTLHQCFISSSWWCLDREVNWEENLGHRYSPIQVRCNASTGFHVEPCSFTIAYVDPDIAWKRVGNSNPQRQLWQWPGDDNSILRIVTLILDMTALSFLNVAISGLPYPGRKIPELWGGLEEPDGDNGPYAHTGTPILDYKSAAGWVILAMMYWNRMLFCIVYRGQQADDTAGAETSIRGGRSNPCLDDILTPPPRMWVKIS